MKHLAKYLTMTLFLLFSGITTAEDLSGVILKGVTGSSNQNTQNNLSSQNNNRSIHALLIA